MFVTVTKSKTTGQKYVYLTESIRDPKTGKNTKRIVQRFGYLEDLEKDNPNFLSELKAKYSKRGSRCYTPDTTVASPLADSAMATSADLANVSDNELRSMYEASLNYGWHVYRNLWSTELDLAKRFNYLCDLKHRYNKDASGKSNDRFNMTVLASMLTCRRAMGCASLLSTFKERTKFVGMPNDGLSQIELYRFIPLIANDKDYLVTSIQKKLSKDFKRAPYSLLFHDVAASPSDASAVQPSSGLSLVDQLEAQEDGKDKTAAQSTSNDSLSSNDQQSSSAQGSTVFVVDKYGIPVDYAAIPVDPAGQQLKEDVLASLKATYHIKHAIAVTSRSLSSCIQQLQLNDKEHGYTIVPQLSKLDIELSDELLNKDSFTPLTTSNGRQLLVKTVDDYVLPSDAAAAAADVSLAHTKGTLVITFDEERKQQEDMEIETILKSLENKVAQKTKRICYKVAWSQFAKTAKVNGETQVVVDEELVAKRRALAGYSCFIMTKRAADSSKAAASTAAVLAKCVEQYEQFDRIDRCYSLIKDSKGYGIVRDLNEANAEGNELLNFIAIILQCLLDKKLRDAGHMLSTEQLQLVLNEMRIFKSIPVKALSSVEPMYRVIQSPKLAHESYTFIDPTTHEQSTKPLANAQFAILNLVCMDYLPATLSKTTLAGCLKTKFRCPDGNSLTL